MNKKKFKELQKIQGKVIADLKEDARLLAFLIGNAKPEGGFTEMPHELVQRYKEKVIKVTKNKLKLELIDFP